MKSFIFLLFISTFVFHIQTKDFTITTADSLVVTKISTNPDFQGSIRSGSKMGGTIVYIKGYGFDAVQENNLVTFGEMRCKVISATTTNLACIISKHQSGDLINIPISVSVGSSSYSCASEQCRFSYSDSNTPQLLSIYPKSGPVGSKMSFYGSRSIIQTQSREYPGDIHGLYIGNSICNRKDIVEQYNTDSIFFLTSCDVALDQEAGQYNVTEWVYQGYAEKNRKMGYYEKSYQFVLTPTITSLSIHKSGSQGDFLTIKGSGFSKILKNNVIIAAKSVCKALSSSSTEIECEVQPISSDSDFGRIPTNSSSQLKGFVFGSGFQQKKYYINDAQGEVSTSDFRTKLQTMDGLTEISEYDFESQPIVGQLQTLKGQQEIFLNRPIGTVMKGYFHAQSTGLHTFRAYSKTPLTVYISKFQGSAQIDYFSDLLLNMTNQNNKNKVIPEGADEVFAIQDSGLVSEPISLKNGYLYYMQIYSTDAFNKDHFRIAFEEQRNFNTKPNTAYEIQKISIAVDSSITSSPTGHFKLSYDGQELTFRINNENTSLIPINVTQEDLQNWMRESYNDLIEVDKIVDTSDLFKYEWLVSFVGNSQNIPQIQITLDQENKGDIIGAQVTNIRNGSTQSYYYPSINSKRLFTASDTSSVFVQVNGVMSQCLGDCSFKFDDTDVPILESVSISNNILTFALSINVAIPYKVTFANQPCTYVQGDFSDYKCSLPLNANNKPLLEAGHYLPWVYIDGKGYVVYREGLQSIYISSQITSVTPNNGYTNGGQLISIVGSGFQQGDNIQLCNRPVIIHSVSNTKIEFYAPRCLDQSEVKLLYNHVEYNDFSFTYNINSQQTLQVEQVLPTSLTPGFLQTLNISGSGFGTDKSKIKVLIIYNNIQVAQLDILEAEDNIIQTKLNKPLDTDYYILKVLKQNYGFAKQITYTLQIQSLTQITQVSPQQGSVNGGTVLTIRGINFKPYDSTQLEHEVFMGTESNLRCQVLSVTNTEITCKTPYNPNPNAISVFEIKIVIGGLLVSSCPPESQCYFTYKRQITPIILGDFSTPINANQNVTLTGEKLKNGAADTRVFVEQNEIIPQFVNDTEIVFIYPKLHHGTYKVKVYVDGIGYSSPFLESRIESKFDQATTTMSGSTKGNIVKLQGKHLPSFYDSRFKVFISDDTTAKEIRIRSDSTVDYFKIDVEECADGKTLTYQFFYDGSKIKTFEYSCLDSETPIVSLQNSTTHQYSENPAIIFFESNQIDQNPSNCVVYPVDSSGKMFADEFSIDCKSESSTQFSVDITSMTCGNYTFKFFFDGLGYANNNFDLFQVKSNQDPTSSYVVSGYSGGPQIKIDGFGLSLFSTLIIDKKFYATLNQASSTSTQLVYYVPAYISNQTQVNFQIANNHLLEGTPYGDDSKMTSFAFDNLLSSKYSSSGTQCYIGLDFGEVRRNIITKARIFLLQDHLQLIVGATISGSQNGISWATLGTVSSNIHAGWNTIHSFTPQLQGFRYIAIRNTVSFGCDMAEFQIYGHQLGSSLDILDSNKMDVDFSDGCHTFNNITQIEYRQDNTPVITDINPKFKGTQGLYPIQITLKPYSGDLTNTEVTIDGIPCTITQISNTIINCTAGKRDQVPSQNSFIVKINRNKAILQTDPFIYVSRWSNVATWQNNILPVDGDSIHIPVGMTLLVDQSTPKLNKIFVEGTIIFADEIDMTIQAETIIIYKGKLQAGKQNLPYQKRLTFILASSPAPTLGEQSKLILCYHCTLDMHGKTKNYKWTQISQTINSGSSTVTLKQAVNWIVGDEIVVSSTSFDHKESEQRKIISIDKTKKKITVDTPFKFQHKYKKQTFGNIDLETTAEVGLLSSNIKVTGDESSTELNHGVVLMMQGEQEKGLKSRITNTEFINCGQRKFLRSCVYFNKNGNMEDSVFIKNSIHHSYARAITLKSVEYLKVDFNVGFMIYGHGVYLQDGLEQNNQITNNLMISNIASGFLLQSDVFPASYWISNPQNNVQKNRAAGSDGYGFYYDTFSQISKTTKVCPWVMSIFQSKSNNAHSNRKSGLRIQKLISKSKPCADDFEISDTSLSIKNTFSNYKLWKNKQNGVHAVEVANNIFSGFMIADHGKSGVEFEVTDFTGPAKNDVILSNSLIVGHFDQTISVDYSGIIAPRTDGSRFNSLSFYNFGDSSFIFSFGSKNDIPTIRKTIPSSYKMKNISIQGSTGNYFKWIQHTQYIVYVQDGSLSSYFDGQTRTKSTIIPYSAQNQITDKCKKANDMQKWDQSLICNQDVQVNNIYFSQPDGLVGQKYKITRLQNFDSVPDPDSLQSSQTSTLLKQKGITTAGFNLISGQSYELLKSGNDAKLDIVIYQNPSSKSKAIILRFKLRSKIAKVQLIKSDETIIDATRSQTRLKQNNCKFGNFYQDYWRGFLFICVSAKGWQHGDGISLAISTCDNNCIDDSEGQSTILDIICPEENTIVEWSKTSLWRDGILPSSGASIIIPKRCNLLMNVDVLDLNSLIINGIVTIKDQNRILSSKFIWIRKGTLQAGTEDNPFKNKFTIRLIGQMSDTPFEVDSSLTLNKHLVVTGKLLLYGKPPSTKYTKLTSKAKVGDTIINVESTKGWKVGNVIGLSPSYSKYNQFEKGTIEALTTKTITFSSALKYPHFGDTAPYSNSTDTIDMRSTVGVLDRNIKIEGDDAQGWGFGVMIYGWIDNDNAPIQGSAVIQGVQFSKGGQYGTTKAALSVINTQIGADPTVVKESSFEDCNDYCMFLSDARSLTVSQNFIIEGQKFMILAQKVNDYQFSNNVMIGVGDRNSNEIPEAENISCYIQKSGFGESNNNRVVNNLCQGSQGQGFIFPFTTCEIDQQNNYFSENIAGSSNMGFIFSQMTPNECQSKPALKTKQEQKQLLLASGVKVVVRVNEVETDNSSLD